MIETSARLLRVLGLLQSRRDWTGEQLGDRLGVTARTVRTDVERLRGLGYAVEAVPGVGGGYRLGFGTAVPPLLLDDDEAVAVAIGLREAAGGAVEGIEETSVRALSKLEQILPTRLRRRVRSLTDATVTVAPITPTPAPAVDPEVLIAIANACRDHERLRLHDESHDGPATRHVVEPHRLVSSAGRWYLLARDVEGDVWRTFRVDGLRLRLPAGPRFAPRPVSEAEMSEQISRGVATAMWTYRAHVTVHAPAAEMVARLPWAITVEAVDDSTCRLEVGSDSPELLAVYLGMLGADFRVDEGATPELAECVRALARRYDAAVCR